MHIAWLGKKSPFCGNVTYGREVTNALLDRGHRVSFLHFAQEEVGSEHWPDCAEVSLPCLYKSQIYTIPTLGSRRILTGALEELRPDLVHASLTLSPLDFVLPEICQEFKLPLVGTFHPGFDRKRRNLAASTQHLTYQVYAPFLAHYNRVIVFSQIQRDLLQRLGVPRERLVTIPNGVDSDRYSPGVSNLKVELEAKHIFVYQGRVAPEKNVETLLRAWKQADMGPDSILVMVGNGPLTASLRYLYGPESGVLWLGFLADEQRRIHILRGADVFILPSLVEGLSLSLLEAMACGLACLATDAGADGEVLEAGAGVVLHPQKLITQLQTLLPLFRDHPELASLLGQKARQRVLERYTLSGNITALEGLYQQVCKQPTILSTAP